MKKENMNPRRGDRDSHIAASVESGMLFSIRSTEDHQEPARRRTRTQLLQERRDERLAMNCHFEPHPQNIHQQSIPDKWWISEPGYIHDPSNMIASSIRLRKKTQEEPIGVSSTTVD